jgi:hypothetical protein
MFSRIFPRSGVFPFSEIFPDLVFWILPVFSGFCRNFYRFRFLFQRVFPGFFPLLGTFRVELCLYEGQDSSRFLVYTFDLVLYLDYFDYVECIIGHIVPVTMQIVVD